jgi:RimJ/RimL family protein N-acetyltransferase
LLETERLLLRKPTLEDADDMLALIEDPEVMRWLGGETGDRAATVERIERWLARWEEDEIGQFSVVRDGRVIGRIGFLVWDGSTWQVSSYAAAGERAVTEIGWALARAEWGHGYATEGARAARNWAYAHGVQSLVSLIKPENDRSASVATKLGAVPAESIEVDGRPVRLWRHL